jgi:GWxTD domain-containing protein
MRIRSFTVLISGLLLMAGNSARADKLDKDSKKWLDDVKALVLPDEEKTFKDLKDRAERDEFRKIFWARRNPQGPETPDNPFRTQYEAALAQAEARFKGKGGAQSDCGQLLLLLGEPAEVKKQGGQELPASRAPETWVYADRPGMKFKDGRMEVPLDENCRLPQGSGFGEQLKRVAEGRILYPSIDYRKGADGKLVRLADQLPKPTPVMALLKSPRRDFGATAETAAFLRNPDGATYVAGLVKIEPAALTPETVEGKKVAKVTVGVQALDEGGKNAASTEREVMGELAADGSFVVSYGVALKPGRYTLQVGVLDAKTGKGNAVTQPLEMPDFNADELSMSPLLVLRDVQETAPNPRDPLWALQIGGLKMMSRFGNVFAKDEAVTLLAIYYHARADATTGNPSVTFSFNIQKDGKTVARADDQTYEKQEGVSSVGPVPLDTYAPGKYVAHVKVRDNVAKKDYTREATFEVR